MKKILKGFTLAEVLITLVVIGIIAAITIPTIMNNIKGREYRAALKKGVSALNQALALHYAQAGVGVQEGGMDLVKVSDIFMQHMHMTPGEEIDSFPNEICVGPNASTTDGLIYCVNWENWKVDENSCDAENNEPCAADKSKPNGYIDVNGEKGPNQVTESGNSPKDQYELMIYNTKVVPFGDATQQVIFEKKSD